MKKVNIFLVICFLVIISYVLIYFNGTPWGRIIAKNKAEAYLKNKYEKEMSIDKTYYNFKKNNYYSVVYTKEKPSVQFKVELSDSDSLKDNYFINLWQEEVRSKVQPYIKAIYSENASCFITIQDNPIYNDYQTKVDKIPSYDEIRCKLKKPVDMNIMIYKVFESGNNEYTKIMDIINFIKEKDFKPDCLTISFSDEEINRLSTCCLSYSELMQIKKTDDIKNFMKFI